MSPAPLERGEIVMEHASRSFSVRADRGRTLKELILPGRRGDGPAPVQALRDVTLHITPGETVGLIGRNGAGKSSTLRVLAGIVPPNQGRVRCGGTLVTLLDLAAGFSRDFSGRENIELNGALHGLSRSQIEERMEPIVAFSELGHFIDVPVKTYSAGMFVRLGFSIAAHLDADVLLIDEVLAVGDEAFQRKCLRRISERIAAGVTLVLVSHDAGTIERVCERVVVLDGGGVAFDGPTTEGLLFYHQLLGTETVDAGPVHRASALTLEVGDIELQNAAGRRCSVFRTGDPLRVGVAVSARTAVDRARVELEVRDQRGARLFSTSTDLALDGPAPVELVFEAARVPLLGGDYDLVVRAGDAAGNGPTFDRVAGFSVCHEAGAEGVADLRGTWSTRAPVEVRG
ncbi:MAG: ABC transporter ATP-binding protein [Actinomycetota bacterium]|nr:ABC transporter ATP-binding protein [Actinomycetota bacterium]